MEEQAIKKQEAIHEKGFKTNFNAVKVQNRKLEDVVLDLNSLVSGKKLRYTKAQVIDAIAKNSKTTLREISDYFYRTDGIYKRTCDYFATMYRYDWYVAPEIIDDKYSKEKITTEFRKALYYLDGSYIKNNCEEWALKTIVNGCFYGYLIEGKDGLLVQELPIKYCRSRYSVNNLPVVEFNMRFFDDKFVTAQNRIKILKMWPKEFQQGYVAYKEGKLLPETPGDMNGWFTLDPENTFKFSMSQPNSEDLPIFINAIPAIIDLYAAQELDRQKMMQKLLKILVQKLPRDKNGDLIFDVDEAADIHQTAVQMLSRAVGVDVFTTFADVDEIDLSDSTTTTSTDELEKSERTVFNAFGVSRNLFNTDGNIALEKSILNDEGSVRHLLLQFNVLFDRIIRGKFAKKNKYSFRVYFLGTTQYNYKDLSKMYKEQVQLGYSKMLPQIALGHSQSSILNTVCFENDVLKLTEVMIPPLMSSTMSSADILGKNNKTNADNQQKTVVDTSDSQEKGRPKKDDSEKSEKTLMNEESKS